MKQKLLLTSFLLAGVSSLYSAQNDWILLDDMEDLSKWTLTQAEDGLGRLDTVADPAAQTGNTIYVNTMGTGVGFAHTSAVLPLQNTIADGETGTIYLKYYQVDISREYIFGFSDVPISGSGTSMLPNDWAHFEGMLQMNPGATVFKVRDGSKYRELSGDGGSSFAELATGTWYEFWIVINNASGNSDDTYAIYVKGGEYTEQTLLQVGVDDGSGNFTYYDDSYFRYGTSDPILSIFVRTLSGANGSNLNDDVYLDHAAQAPGVELTTPIGWTDEGGFGSWEGYAIVNEAGDADTGAWMGWVNTKKAPWIYCYSLDSWVYVKTGSVTSAGAWVYIKK